MMDKAIVLRLADPGEEERILAFYHELIDLLRDAEFRPSWKKGVYPTLDDICPAVKSRTMYVAEDRGSIIGAVNCNHMQGVGYEEVPWVIQAPSEKIAVIHLLAVDPRCRGRGIGKEMLKKAADVSRSDGCISIRLDTLPWNKPAKRLYESFGFQWRGDIPITYPSTGTIPFSMYEFDLRLAESAKGQ